MDKVIDLFSGVGGFSCGFEKAGFTITAAVEFDKNIAASYEKNHPNTKMYAKDIRDIDNENTFKKGAANIIIGGPPCQGFSMAGARIRKNGFIDDPRNFLFKHYFNLVKIIRPKVFLIENVKGILTIKNGEIFKEIVNIFTDPSNFEGKPYKISYKVLKAKEFGIPQARERVVIIGTLFDFDFEKELELAKKEILSFEPNFFDSVSVWDAISNLPVPTLDGEITVNHVDSNYQRNWLHTDENISNHMQTAHSSKAVERMSKIKVDENFRVLNENIKSVHSGSYGRLNPAGIAPTITTRFDTPSGGKFIHPYENRTITPREAARLQSFPDAFKFYGTKTCICKQIGNAVPPKLAYVLGVMIRRVMNYDI